MMMKTCEIMHNMIRENERGQEEKFEYDYIGTYVMDEQYEETIRRLF